MALRHFLLGRRCVFCGLTIDPQNGDGYCSGCACRLRDENLICPRQIGGEQALFVYSGPVRQGVHTFKYGGDKEFGLLFGARLADLCRKTGIAGDIVTCVPRSPDGQERVYNQSEVLARAFAKRLKLPLDADLLAKKKHVRSQTECRSRKMRLNNVQNAFYPGPSARDISGKTVLLVDDILTTGATVRACAEVLKQRGAKDVYVFTVAKAEPRRRWHLRYTQRWAPVFFPAPAMRYTVRTATDLARLRRSVKHFISDTLQP